MAIDGIAMNWGSDPGSTLPMGNRDLCLGKCHWELVSLPNDISFHPAALAG